MRKLLTFCLSCALVLTWAEGAHAEPAKRVVRHYLAMGDSYVSKPGFQKQYADGGLNCARTEDNYPAGVAAGLGLSVDDGFTDVSCAGAKSNALTTEQFSAMGVTVPPQLDAVTEDTDLVTMTFGANDQDFMVQIVATCVMIDLTGEEGSPCRKEGPDDVPILSDKGFAGVRDNIHRDLRGAVDTIKNKAPDSRVALVGYAQTFPTGKECTGTMPMTPGDMAWVNERVQGINATIQQVAKETGQIYVDIYTPSIGHGICAKDPWESGLATTNWLNSEPLHLTPLGGREVSKIVLAKILASL